MDRRRPNGVNWKNFYGVTVAAVMLPVGCVWANIPIPTRAQSMQWIRMQEMHWVAALSAQQVHQVRSALGSGYNPAVEEALINVILHGLDDLVPVVGDGVGTPKSVARQFGKICADVLNIGTNPFQQLRAILSAELPGDDLIAQGDKLESFRPVRYLVTSVIVFDQIRAVRTGQKKEADLAGLELSLFEKELAKFSGLGAGAAVAGILDQLSKVRVITPRETTLIQVLHTYPPQKYLPAVLDKLELDGESEGYETTLLLRSLSFRCDKLSKGDKARLRYIIDSVRHEDISPSFEMTLSALESELQ